jgi:hypothetical protein
MDPNGFGWSLGSELALRLTAGSGSGSAFKQCGSTTLVERLGYFKNSMDQEYKEQQRYCAFFAVVTVPPVLPSANIAIMATSLPTCLISYLGFGR